MPAPLKHRFLFFAALFFIFNFTGFSQASAPNEWDPAKLDLAKGFAGLSETESNVIFEINKARANPKKYAELYIQPLLESFNGTLFKGYLQTKEGATVVEECIKVMSSHASLPPLNPDEKLVKMARTHTDKQGKTKEAGHDTPGGKSFKKRFRKYIKKGFVVGENISYGEKEARHIVAQLLIDDGVKSRGHRKNILDPDYTMTGTACGSHGKYAYMCTIDFYGPPKKRKKK